MTETELKTYIQAHFPIENEACEWKEFKSLKHSFSGKAGYDIISYISASIAQTSGDKSTYIKLRGFKDEHYKKLILEYLDKYKQASKTDIDNLILDILPDILDEQKKANKVRNIIYAMSKKDQTIVNKGTTRYPKWKKV